MWFSPVSCLSQSLIKSTLQSILRLEYLTFGHLLHKALEEKDRKVTNC